MDSIRTKPIRTVLLSLLCFCSVGISGTVDHLPAHKLAMGKPEHFLSGVEIYRGSIEGVIKRLGKPDKVDDKTDSNYPAGSGERSYLWSRGNTTLRIGTEYRTDPATHRIIEGAPMIVDVWGKSAEKGFGTTGAGLSLGSTLSELEKIYGKKFESGDKALTLQWKDETTMVVDFDNAGRIKHIQLVASVE